VTEDAGYVQICGEELIELQPYEEEIVELTIHLAFYTGWRKAMSAVAVARRRRVGVAPARCRALSAQRVSPLAEQGEF